MRAIKFEKTGALTELKLQELPQPSIKVNEVLVEIHAAAVNPSDVKNVLGMMPHTTLPRIPGRDFAGVVVAGQESLVGMEVWGTGGELGFTRDGTHAEYIILPVDGVKPKPKTLSMEAAAAVGVGMVTAGVGLMRSKLKPGETLLALGATGAVGSAALQIARWKGVKTIGTIRKASDEELVKKQGVDTVINLGVEDLKTAVLTATNGTGVDVIFDTVGGSMFEQCLDLLGKGGRIIEISTPANQRQVSFNLFDFYRRDLQLIGVNSLFLDVVACAEILEQLTTEIEAHGFQPKIAEIMPLEKAIAAYELVENNQTQGKVIISPKTLDKGFKPLV